MKHPEKNFFDIDDDDIRIVGKADKKTLEKEDDSAEHCGIECRTGFCLPEQSESRLEREFSPETKKRINLRNPKTLAWLFALVILIVGLMVWIIQELAGYKSISNEILQNRLSVTDNSIDTYSYPLASIEEITANGLKLRYVIPMNATPTLEIGHECLSDSTIICGVQAASIAFDKEGESHIVGAFVLKGTPMSWGRSKAGYCAIMNDSIYIGASKRTPLFEEATEKGGYFFRQYSLVEGGRLSSMRNTDSHIRRALCVRNGMVQVVETIEKVVLNDFTQALIDSGVSEALMLEGGDALMWWVDDEGKRTDSGSVNYPDAKAVSYLVWR